jgi:hypothetical protein
MCPVQDQGAARLPDRERQDAWRPLGEILVDRRLISPLQLHVALREQEKRGGRLGEILYERNWVSPVDLRDALAEQYGLDLRVEPSSRPATALWDQPNAVPLGQLLVRRGQLTPRQLTEALDEQARTGQRLGQILLGRGLISAGELASALAEQEGLTAARRELENAAEESVLPRPDWYEVRETIEGKGYQLFASRSFLDATDLAFAVLQEWEPTRLEVVKIVHGDLQEVCWHYPPT